MKKGTLVVISAPSGGGKTTVIKLLLKRLQNAGRVVTSTSRDVRNTEVDGVDYHFMSVPEFEQKIKDDGFYEHAVYAGNHYGVEKAKLDETLENKDFALIALDFQGKKHFDSIGLKHVSIFLIPENMELLEKNIDKRGGMDVETLKKRMAVAQNEVNQADIYDYQIMNVEGQLETVVDQIEAILANLS